MSSCYNLLVKCLCVSTLPLEEIVISCTLLFSTTYSLCSCYFAIASVFADIFSRVGSRPGAPIKLLGVFLKELEAEVQLLLLLQHRKQDILTTRPVPCFPLLPHTSTTGAVVHKVAHAYPKIMPYWDNLGCTELFLLCKNKGWAVALPACVSYLTSPAAWWNHNQGQECASRGGEQPEECFIFRRGKIGSLC